MDRPYSVRDLRLGHDNEYLRTVLQGDYFAESRRWRFTNATNAREARTIAEKRSLHVLHLPGIDSYTREVMRFSGFHLTVNLHDEILLKDPQAQEWQNGWKRGINTMLFPDRDHMEEALEYLHDRSRLGALGVEIRNARAAYASLPTEAKDAHIELLNERLRATGRVWKSDCQTIQFRADAFAKYRPSSPADAKASEADAIAMAQTFGRALNRVPSDNGHFAGLLVGRSAYHYVVQLNEEGDYAVFNRASIRMPLKKSGHPGEIGAERLAATSVLVHHGVGDMLQIKDEHDLDLGALYVTAKRRAANDGLAEALKFDEFTHEDTVGSIVTNTEYLSVIYDDAAFATVVPSNALPISASIDRKVSFGPSYSTTTGRAQRRASR